MEEHFIFFGSNKYQILFDAEYYDHDVLIRGQFFWSENQIFSVTSIKFLLDNLHKEKHNYELKGCFWCARRRRLELHLSLSAKDVGRSILKWSFPEEVNFKTKIELALRIIKGEQRVKECQDYELPRYNPIDKHQTLIEAWTQDDKDGSILIGTDSPRR